MEKLSKLDIKKAEQYGGADGEWGDYTRQKALLHYSDCGGHMERSLANDPKHARHWREAGKTWVLPGGDPAYAAIALEQIHWEGDGNL